VSSDRGPERLRDILGRAVVRPARKARSAIARARRRWEAVAGSATAEHSRPRSLRRGVLSVEVDSSALLADLAGYRRARLLEGLNAGDEALGVRELRFVLSEGVR
jgi:predicted nucleic acid-binding Zn ribbon protein